jgi:uncharacterized membrane protein YhaH (DUF805 family)
MTDASVISVPPLDQPHYGIGVVAAVKRLFQKYATFSGRASRSEYWCVVLAFGAFSVPFSILNAIAVSAGVTMDSSGISQPGPFSTVMLVFGLIVVLATIVPHMALTVRRLHDANLSGLLYLLNLVPYLGSLLLAAIAARPSNPQGARFDAVRSATGGLLNRPAGG